MTTANDARRLFVPLSGEPFQWFSSGKKEWEVRRNKGAFRADRLTRGRRVELRMGYTGESLWGTLAETVIATNTAQLFDRISYKAAVPTATSPLAASTFVENLLSKDSELVAFRIELDPAGSNTPEIRFDPALLELIEAGKKKTTIRFGHRDYRPGPVRLRFGESAREGAIVQNRLTSVDALTVHDAQSDGFQTIPELIAVLRRYYPDLTHTSPITIVEFTCRLN